jgi:membrane protein
MAHERETSPGRFGGLSVAELGRRVWHAINEDEILDRAAALSYYVLFALFPGLLFLAAFLGFLPIQGTMDLLLKNLGRFLPGDALSLVQKTLQEALQASRVSLLSIGAVAALWTASSGMASVMAALNVAYHVPDSRPWWKRRGIAVVLTFGFSVLLVTALVLMVFGPKLGAALANRLGLQPAVQVALNVLSVVFPVAFLLVGLALVYYFGPATEQAWHWVTPGSVVATVVWLAASFGLRLYVKSFANYSATYGSLGGAILLMLWLYVTGVILLLGAEINSEIENAAAERGNQSAQRIGDRALAA